jgi:predicted TIM-barrel fold metal-dependent hydrolase
MPHVQGESTAAQPAIIDVHAHCLPKELDELLTQRHHIDVLLRPKLVPQDAPVSDSEDDVARRLQLMDEAGVALQVLSVPPPPVFSSEEDAVEVARLANDRHAALVNRHPDRFAAYAHLPLPYLDASLRELARATDALGMGAVVIACSFDGVSAVAERFDPLYEQINRLGKAVFFHPAITGLCSPLITEFGLQGPLGALLEDSVLATQIVMRQLPLKYPNIPMIVPHLGGILPLYLERMDNQLAHLIHDTDMRPREIAKLLYYDTVSHSSTVSLRAATESLGASRLLTGSDYPALEYFDGYQKSINYVREADLPPQHVDAILHTNAARLFPMTRARTATS